MFLLLSLRDSLRRWVWSTVVLAQGGDGRGWWWLLYGFKVREGARVCSQSSGEGKAGNLVERRAKRWKPDLRTPSEGKVGGGLLMEVGMRIKRENGVEGKSIGVRVMESVENF